jgi:hypothetical protein
MLTKLIPVDDLPLKLGQRLPRKDEKAKAIAQMEACAKVLDALDKTVQWVRDDRTPLSDFDHPAADMGDPMAIVASEFEKSASKYEKMFSSKHWLGVDPGRHGGDMTAAVRYSFKDGDIHVESIATREMYADYQPTNEEADRMIAARIRDYNVNLQAEVGITDIMRGVSNGVADTTNLGVLTATEWTR